MPLHSRPRNMAELTLQAVQGLRSTDDVLPPMQHVRVMEVHDVGPDSLGDDMLYQQIDAYRYIWLVYSYEADFLVGGRGEALALREDGVLCWKRLGHDSTCGPIDSWEADCDELTVDEFLGPKKNDCRTEIMNKARELLGK